MIEPLNDLTEALNVGLCTNDNYQVIKWSQDAAEIFFSYTRQGNAIFAHLAADKDSRKYLKQAVNEVAEMFFVVYEWCEFIIAAPVKKSVLNLLLDCDFKIIGQALVGNNDDLATVMSRGRM